MQHRVFAGLIIMQHPWIDRLIICSLELGKEEAKAARIKGAVIAAFLKRKNAAFKDYKVQLGYF